METVNGASALLVVDLQCGLFETKPPPFDAAAVIRNIDGLARRCRASAVHVVYIQNDGSPEENLVPMTAGWRLLPELQVLPQDLVIRKTTCDAFYQTSLESELRARAVQNLVITGYATDFCIDSTVRNAVSRGFNVLVPADAHTTNDNPVLKASQIRQHHNWVWANCTAHPPIKVVPVSEVEFRRAG